MPNNETSWTTVSGKTKAKVVLSSNKSAPVVAPVIPKAEVKTIKLSDSAFSAMKSRIEDENENNEVQKPVPTVDKNLAAKVVKPTKPSSNALTLKQALQNVSADKLKQLYKPSNGNASLWIENICYGFIEQLKDVTSGANDPTFAKEGNSEYPMNALPTNVRDYLDGIFDDTKSKLKAITLCRNSMLHPNADITAIASYQVLLQYFLRKLDERPTDSFLDDINELSASLKRYPSDKVLRLLWAYSQVQYEQPGLALNIWFYLMFPFVENRTYNQFVIETLSQLTTRNMKNKKFLLLNGVFPMKSYIKLLDFVDRPNPALTRELRSSLAKSASILSESFSINPKTVSPHANEYFKHLFPAVHGDKQRSSNSQSAIDRMIVACMTDKSVIKSWLLLHHDYPESSLNLLSLLSTNGTSIPGLSSSQDLRTIVQQLHTISNQMNDHPEHVAFLRVYATNDTVVVNKRRTRSKSRIGFIFKLLVLLAISFAIYQHWLWLTVAAEYIFEDHLKHPTAIALKQRLADGYKGTKKLTESSIKYGEEYVRLTMSKVEPHATQLGQYIQKRWFLLLKYVEGPVLDKTIEIAEQIQKLSSIIFTETAHYLNILFNWTSHYTAHATDLTKVYVKQAYAILDDKWKHLDTSELRNKFDELRMKVIKSV